MGYQKQKTSNRAVILALIFGAAIFAAAIFAATSVLAEELFVTSDRCVACHNGLVSQTGEDHSIGTSWSSTMMANAAKDPYWQATVAREVKDHPSAAKAIEDKCSTCHMPISRYLEKMERRPGRVLDHLPITGKPRDPEAASVRDGVSCTVCHQIQGDNLGQPESFTGGFAIDEAKDGEPREIYGPFEINDGVQKIMSSATGFAPKIGTHIQKSQMCATCHTLYTHALDENGREVGVFPEQVPYLEWLHSDFKDSQSCLECHMDTASGKVSISSVLGAPREPFSKHSFRGGNFFMLKLLGKNGRDLGVTASHQSLNVAVADTATHLVENSANLSIDKGMSRVENGKLKLAVKIENMAGHKLPTAYPSRRVWLYLNVSDSNGEILFESGRLSESGSIEGNDNDIDPLRFETHYTEIVDPAEVQIYEAIMVSHDKKVTTGLLQATDYVKDNRILPMGFDKKTAGGDIAVHGNAFDDINFQGGEDITFYTIDLKGKKAPFKVTAECWYQPIGFRWAKNLEEQKGPSTPSFFEMYHAMPKTETALRLAATTETIDGSTTPTPESDSGREVTSSK